jgi:hypothetical protein
VGEVSERARDEEIRDDPGRTAEARRLIAEVETALSEDDQQLFRLRFTEGLRPADVAERLGRNPDTITNCPELRDILQTHEDEHGPTFTAELAKAFSVTSTPARPAATVPSVAPSSGSC